MKKSIIVLLIIIFSFSSSPFVVRQEVYATNYIKGIATNIMACYATKWISGALDKFFGLGSFLSKEVPVNDKEDISQNKAEVNKECILDAGANGLKREIIRATIRDGIDWVNGGAEGKPKFGENLLKFTEDTKNAVLDEVIYNNKNLRGLCTGFELPIKFALYAELGTKGGVSSRKRYQPKCTLDDIEKNIKDSVEDVKNFYSWGKFLEVTTNPDSNAYGSYFGIKQDIINEANRREQKKIFQLSINNGFRSERYCRSDEWQAAWRLVNDWEPGMIEPDYTKYDNSDLADAFCPITTAGRTISQSLSKFIGMEKDELALADEFDEIIGAVLNQLVSKLVGKITGVRGFSEARDDRTGKKYSEEADPSFENFKEMYIKRYSVKSYNIALNILDSRRKTIANASGIYNNAVQCWDSKKESKDNGGEFFKNGTSYNNYIELTDATVSTSRSYLGSLSGKFSKEMEEVNARIREVLEDKARAQAIASEVNAVKSYSELLSVTDDAGVNGVDVELENNKREQVTASLETLINGKIVKYDKHGPVRKGGVAVSKQYCEGFTITQRPLDTSTDDPIIFTPSVSNVQTLPSVKVSFVDRYDPANDKGNSTRVTSARGGQSLASGDSKKTTGNKNAFDGYDKNRGDCKGIDGYGKNKEIMSTLSFTKKGSDKCYSATGAICEKGIFKHPAIKEEGDYSNLVIYTKSPTCSKK